MDLETAAHDLLLKVRSLREKVGEVKGASQKCINSLDRIGTRVHDDAEALRAADDALLAAFHETEETLAKDGPPVKQSLSEAAAACEEAGTQGTILLDAESAVLETLPHELLEDQRHVIERADAAESQSHSALEHAGATSKTIETSRTELEHGFAALVQELEQGRQVNEAEEHRLEEGLEHDAEGIEEAAAYWPDKLHDAREALDRAMESMQTHMTEVAAYSVEKVGALMEHEVDLVESDGNTLRDELDRLTRAVEEKQGQVSAAGELVVEQEHAAQESATALEDQVETVRARWANLGF
jgi:chromosome segregation ATPase